MIYRLARVAITFAWAYLIYQLLTWPGMVAENLPVAKITYADKAVHFVLFGLLTYFLAKTLYHFWLKRQQLVLLSAIILPTVYGLILEEVQRSIPGRSTDILDSMAGFGGSLVAAWIYTKVRHLDKPKLLMQICCIGCGAYLSRELSQEFQLTLFFYNPNIYPKTEHDLRLEETQRIAKKYNYKLVVGEYDHSAWLRQIAGHEHEPERGGRCVICYRDRLSATAKLAKEKGFDYFGSTLTISPYKVASAISQLGNELAAETGVKFLDRDFKKQDGYKKSIAVSKELNLYRQDYCGCEFSIRPPKANLATINTSEGEPSRVDKAELAESCDCC